MNHIDITGADELYADFEKMAETLATLAVLQCDRPISILQIAPKAANPICKGLFAHFDQLVTEINRFWLEGDGMPLQLAELDWFDPEVIRKYYAPLRLFLAECQEQRADASIQLKLVKAVRNDSATWRMTA